MLIWDAISSSSNYSFSGVFDGNGYVMLGLKDENRPYSIESEIQIFELMAGELSSNGKKALPFREGHRAIHWTVW